MRTEELLIFSGLLISAFFILYFSLFNRIERGGRNYIIAGLSFALYTFLYDFFLINGYNRYLVWFYIFYLPIIFSFYPIIYHYLVYAVGDKNKRILVKVFSYLPLVVFLLLVVFYLPLDFQSKIDFITKDINSFKDQSEPYKTFQIIIHSLYYFQFVIFTTIFFHLYFSQRKRKSAGKNKKLFLPGWLFLFITIIIMYEVIYLFIVLFDFSIYDRTIEAIANFMFLFLLGFLGVYHDAMMIKMKLESEDAKEVIDSLIIKKETIEPSDAELVINKLEMLISGQKLYKNPGLKLEHIAKKFHIPVNKLSMIINRQTGNNFSFFLNKIRIDEAKHLMHSNEKKQKIEDIYLQVGYYTRSTFNRAFKQIEGKTPTEFISSDL